MSDQRLPDEDLIDRLNSADQAALAELFDRHRYRLRQMVKLRLDQRLQGRLDPSDVLQEAFLDLALELPSFLEKREFSVFLWMRMVTGQRLMRVHRHHLGTQMRNAGREISHFGGVPPAESATIAARLLGRLTSAAQAAIRAEVQAQLQEALNSMNRMDREIIALRNFEELDNREAAEVLGLAPDAARKRYVRALKRLQNVLNRFPGLLES